MTEPVFIALDFPNEAETLQFLKQFDVVTPKPALKIGMELFYKTGPDFVKRLRRQGYIIFLDLKLYDIPTTVKKAIQSLNSLDVQYLTVHASGGEKMLQAAVSVAQMKLLAVTQLTSFSQEDVQVTQLTSASLLDSVINLAKIAYHAGVAGTISSPLEAQAIAKATNADFLRITPGIRLANDDSNDQKRVMTPSRAKQNGSTGLVVGRSITQATDPLTAYQTIMKEWQN